MSYLEQHWVQALLREKMRRREAAVIDAILIAEVPSRSLAFYTYDPRDSRPDQLVDTRTGTVLWTEPDILEEVKWG